MKIFEKRPVFFVAIAAIFFAILLVVFRDFAFDSNQLMYNSDQLRGVGTRILRAENVIVTEWDDSRLGGVPTIDAQFADVYHPLVWTQFLMDPMRAVGFKFILTVFVAFMSAFALGWHLTKNRWWGALLGFLYAFAPEYFTYIYGGHDGKMMVFAVAPLAVLSIRKVVRSASIPYMALLALSIAWMILSPHVQLTYLFLWGAGLYTLYEVAFHCDGLKTKGKRLGLAAVGLAFGLTISAIQLVPTYMYTTTQSVRGDDAHTGFGHAASWSLHQEEMAQMLLPGFIGVSAFEATADGYEGSSLINFSRDEIRDLQGKALGEETAKYLKMFKEDPRNSQMPEELLKQYAERYAQQSVARLDPYYWGHNFFKLDHNYAGALLTFLGFLCLFLPGKRRYAAFWGIGAVIALSYGMGAHSPLFSLWYKILPGIKNFRAAGMALFWLPLLLVMMAGPVLKALSGETSSYDEQHGRTAGDNRRALFHGLVMYVILLTIVVIARFSWTSFIAPLGLVVMIAFAAICLGVMSLDDQNQNFSFGNLGKAYGKLLPGTSRGVQAVILLGFVYIGIMMMSGQELPPDAGTSDLNEAVMNATAGKIVPGFILVLVIIAVSWFVLKSKLANVAKMVILVAVAGAELFVVDAAFIKNVPVKDYIQPDMLNGFKNVYKADSLNTPRILSLAGGPLGPNAFPQFNLRNANGDHDNELASSRLFRGERNANYLLNWDDPDAAHPFLDLMNVSMVLDGKNRWNPTAMGEAYLFGEAVVMTDEDAIKTLQTQAAIRKEKVVDSYVEPSLEADSASAAEGSAVANDSSAAPSVAALPPVPKFADEEGKFFYREKVILSEAPSKDYKGSVAANGPINGKAHLVERPKMDTQVFDVEADRPGFMVVAGNYHPYWKAYVNDSEVKVYKAFGTLRAIEIPQGKSRVRMEYRSEPFHKLVPISLGALGVLIVLCFVSAARRKK